ncbi:hypothetical protein BU23DRAFT_551857, partial [Bimuria novae-zelandiae CBS 107.79]
MPVAVTDAMQREIADFLALDCPPTQQRPRQAVALYKELMDVLHRKGVFEKHGVDLSWQSFADYTDPADWWQIQSCTDELKELAIYALSINPTTGAAERNWSEHGFFHNKVRNRLVNTWVEKLVFCYYNLHIRDLIIAKDA